MPQDAKKNQPSPIKEVLKNTLTNIINKGEPYYREELQRAWEESAGKQASKHSTPTGFYKNQLVVSVDSPTWIYQITTKKEEIELKLNETLQKKKKITIRLRIG